MKQIDMVQVENIFALQSNLHSRLEHAYQHAKNYRQLNDAIFPYQDFSLTMKDLFDIALGYVTFPFPQKAQHVERCFEHMLFHKQENITYWGYQSFSFTLFEILEECLRKVKPSAILEIKQDMRNFHKEYEAFSSSIQSVKKSIADSF